MKTGLCLVIGFLINFSVVSAQSLLDKADSLEQEYKFYGFKDSNTIYLTSLGSLERQFPQLKLKSIDYDKSSGLTPIEGLVDVCCFDIIIAKAKNVDMLINVRRFGVTEEITEISKETRFTGRFSLKLKLTPKDVLLIGNPGTLYWGATIIPLGKILEK